MVPFSTGLGWSVLRLLGRTRIVAAGSRCGSPLQKMKKEEGSAGASPVAAPMPKSVPR